MDKLQKQKKSLNDLKISILTSLPIMLFKLFFFIFKIYLI
jgi:hypothetical protein